MYDFSLSFGIRFAPGGGEKKVEMMWLILPHLILHQQLPLLITKKKKEEENTSKIENGKTAKTDRYCGFNISSFVTAEIIESSDLNYGQLKVLSQQRTVL